MFADNNHAGDSVGRSYGDEWLDVTNEAIQKVPSAPHLDRMKRP